MKHSSFLMIKLIAMILPCVHSYIVFSRPFSQINYHDLCHRHPHALSCEGESHLSSSLTTLESLQREYNELEGLYQYYHYVRQRNEAQIDSFIDENAQWEAQDQYDRDIITNHPKVLARMEKLDELIKDLVSSNEVMSGDSDKNDQQQLEAYTGPISSFEEVVGGFHASELGLKIMVAPSKICSGLGMYIVLDEDTFEVEVPAKTIISGYSQRGSLKKGAVEGKDTAVAFLFDTIKRGVIFEKKFQSLAEVLQNGKRQLLGHTIDDKDGESLLVDLHTQLHYLPVPRNELIEKDDDKLYCPQEIGVYCNDLAFEGPDTTEENYYSANEDFNALELVWRLALDESNDTLLVPTWPVIITRKDLLFNNTEPMEIGLSYGWNYWAQTTKELAVK